MNKENLNIPSEDIEVSKFASNYIKQNKTHLPLRNLYVFKTINKNGDVIDEKYGVNLVTRNGFSRVPFDSVNGTRLYLGDGSGTPSYSDTSLFHYIGDVPYSSSTVTNFPIYYDSDNDLICQYRKLGEYTIDYIYLDTSFDITEFGMWYDNKLLTHGLILDSSGNPSHITKSLYDKLIIELRWLYVISPEVQNRLIASNIYGILQPRWNTSSIRGCWVSDTYNTYDSYKNDDDETWGYANLFNKAASVNSQIKMADQFMFGPPILCERNYEYISSFIVKDSPHDYTRYGFYFVIPVYGDREELVCDHIRSDDSNPDSTFNHAFQSIHRGRIDNYKDWGIFPVTNFTIESSYMYNFEDHAWNIPDQINSCENSDFSNRSWRASTEVKINNPDGITKSVGVYVNNNTNIPITQFDVSGVVLYATDTWWDNTTWTLITNPKDIPLAQRNKQYYICESEVDGGLKPTRDQECPLITYSKQYTWDKTSTYETNTSISPTCTSDQYEFYCTPTKIFFHPEGLPGGYDQNTACVMKDLQFTWGDDVIGPGSANPQVNTSYRHCFEDKLVICSGWYYASYSWRDTNTSGTHIRILDISDSSINMDPNAQTPYVDLQLDFTNKQRQYASEIVHGWDGDFWIAYEQNAKEIVAVKIHGGQNNDTPVQTLVDSNIASYTFDYGNDHLIYVKTDDPFTFYYYNLNTNTVDETFNIQSFDSSVTTVNNYAGYNGYIYITAKYSAGDWFTYFYIPADHEWKVDKTKYSTAFGGIFNLCGYNDKCCVFSLNNTGSTDFVIIDASDPLNFTKSTDTKLRWLRPVCCDLRYVNNGKQLLLFMMTIDNDNNNSSSWRIYQIFDMGLFLDTHQFPPQYGREDNFRYNDYGHQSCFYKDDVLFRGNFSKSSKSLINILPVSKFIYHKMTISTNNLTGYNNPFSILQQEIFQILHSTTTDRLLADPCDPMRCAYCTIYRIDMYESSTLSHRFVPCIRDVDSTIGLYDTVVDEFLAPMDPGTMTADTSTTITTDYSLPSGYTQVYSISYPNTVTDSNWFTTADMLNPIIHTEHTKIEWYGNIPTPTSRTYAYILFGSQEYDTEDEHNFVFCSSIHSALGSFAFKRGTKDYVVKAGTYDTDIKIVCDGLTASWYYISNDQLIDSITCDGTLDDGVTPFAFLTRGLPNGHDYSTPPL